MFEPKDLTYNFVILVPDGNPSLLMTTVGSVRCSYDVPCVAVVPENVHPDDFAECQQHCPTYKAGDTVTSLINTGIRAAEPGWAVVTISGTILRPGLVKKYSHFVEDAKDVLYPVIDRKADFVTGSINGLMVHRDTFLEVGDFATQVSFDLCKLLWATDAIEKGVRFKAVVGPKFC